MAIDNSSIIDLVSIDLKGNVVLTISDHLEWDLEKEHLLLLQNKINAYLGAIENGDLYSQYPNAIGRTVIIFLAVKYDPNNEAEVFLNSIKDILNGSGYYFTYKKVEDKMG
jgi:hypothetical protein